MTGFRGILGTTPEALAEARRVLVPGGQLGFTVWGRIKKSPGAWSLPPFQLKRRCGRPSWTARCTMPFRRRCETWSRGADQPGSRARTATDERLLNFH